jgi:hypothetical protein
MKPRAYPAPTGRIGSAELCISAFFTRVFQQKLRGLFENWIVKFICRPREGGDPVNANVSV